jgi:hypothetical protein
MPKDPIVITCHYCNHHCGTSHYIYAGTDLIALESNLEHPVWLVSRGAEPGIHLNL